MSKTEVFSTVRRQKTRPPGTDFSSWSPAAPRRTMTCSTGPSRPRAIARSRGGRRRRLKAAPPRRESGSPAALSARVTAHTETVLHWHPLRVPIVRFLQKLPAPVPGRKRSGPPREAFSSDSSPKSETVDNFVAAKSTQLQQSPTTFNKLAPSG